MLNRHGRAGAVRARFLGIQELANVRVAADAGPFRGAMMMGSGSGRILNTVLAVAAFAATCLGLRAILPLPEVEQLTPKLRFFLAHRDEFDTLFIGSSRLYRGVSPAVFDQVMAVNGYTSHSFNCGLDGTLLPERLYFTEQLLKARPRHLKWVFVEFTGLPAMPNGDELRTRRAVEWHDWARTSLMIRKAVQGGKRRERVKFTKELSEVVVLHLQLFGRRAANVGRAWDFDNLFSPSVVGRPPEPALGKRQDGYLPLTAPMNEKQIAKYNQRLAKEAELPPRQVSDPLMNQAYRRSAEMIRKSGAVPVFILAPVISKGSLVFPRGGPPARVLAFNDMKMYPSFYRVDFRADHDHLNDRGAEEFSKVLAERFAAELRAGGIR